MLKNSIISMISLVISIFVLELFLRLFTQFPINYTSNKVYHNNSLYVLDSRNPEIDKFGFRNKNSPKGQEIFVLGDSHTYGNNVKSEHSWPRQLHDIINTSVYNMGIGSYSVYQYYSSFEFAIKYEPRYVVVGLYPANDIAGRACKVLQLDYWQTRIREFGLKNTYCRKNYKYNSIETNFFKRAVTEIRLHSAVVSSIYHLIWTPIRIFLETIWYHGIKCDSNSEVLCIIQEQIKFGVLERRALTHVSSTDLKDSLILENFYNSLIIFKEMKKMADKKGIRLLILLIPSKERVFVTWAKTNRAKVPHLLNLVYERTL